MARLRLWQPASISGEVSEEPLLYYSYRCTEFRTGQSGEDDFCSVSGQIGNYAGSQRSAKGQMHLSGQPGGSKAIAYGSSEDHTDYGCGILPGKAKHQGTLNQCKKKKSDEISAGRSCQFSDTSAECGKYRESGSSQAELDQTAYGSGFRTEYLDSYADGTVCKCDRNRAYRYRD